MAASRRRYSSADRWKRLTNPRTTGGARTSSSNVFYCEYENIKRSRNYVPGIGIRPLSSLRSRRQCVTCIKNLSRRNQAKGGNAGRGDAMTVESVVCYNCCDQTRHVSCNCPAVTKNNVGNKIPAGGYTKQDKHSKNEPPGAQDGSGGGGRARVAPGKTDAPLTSSHRR